MSASPPEIWFYHLERSSLEATLPPLLERCLARGWRAIVRGGLRERLEALDVALWTYRDDSFLPHGLDDAPGPERQPVLLTTQGGNPNAAQALFALDGADVGDAAAFARTCLVFDGRDDAALSGARARWKALKQAGAKLAYWRETPDGRWEKQQ
jgi:DNA polymerase-3 subunit chi